ncbi:glycosyltransferase family 2 protein [Pedobacter sp. SYP-B3415]|uniref:glycosyltransferase family 2 protein n=1 Tax=Pedobacter sp. SYP-B3415 TaxID=2496641 RepID=UPI00101B97B5|nr:glycosyltransferase family 2 protein [Pedobacter sp. SYP-B3415]
MKISVITINYNNAEGLKRTLTSVSGQDYTNLEHIVIDGGSQDESVAVVKKYGDFVAYFVSEPDNGIYHAMNKGVSKATGDYLLFVNSGDRLTSATVVSRSVSFGLSADLIIGDLLFVNGEVSRRWSPPDHLTFGHFFQNTIPHPSTFIRRSLFEQIGKYDESLKIVSDWKFFTLAICKYNVSYSRIHAVITEFNEDGVSSDPAHASRISSERDDVIKKEFPAFRTEYEELLRSRLQLRKLRYTIRIKKILGIR